MTVDCYRRYTDRSFDEVHPICCLDSSMSNSLEIGGYFVLNSEIGPGKSGNCNEGVRNVMKARVASLKPSKSIVQSPEKAGNDVNLTGSVCSSLQ